MTKTEVERLWGPGKWLTDQEAVAFLQSVEGYERHAIPLGPGIEIAAYFEPRKSRPAPTPLPGRATQSKVLPFPRKYPEQLSFEGVKPGEYGKRNGVYFAKAEIGGAVVVKIGYARHCADKRVTSWSTGCPAKVTILAVLPGPPELERELHRRFAADRINGEWFRYSPAIKEFLKEHQ